MRFREDTISDPLAGTCDWIFTHPGYETWIERRDIICITGGPGSDKSVLLKHLLQKNRKTNEKRSHPDLVFSFFFHGAGYGLEKSRIGFLRSLLWQIISQTAHVLPADFVLELRNVDRDWVYPRMRDLLHRCVSTILTTTEILLVVDGLDECEEGFDGIWTAILETIIPTSQSEESRLGLVLSTRRYHENIFNDTHVRINLNNGNAGDIEHYVITTSHLHTSNVDELRLFLANHSFQYSVMKVGDLSGNKGLQDSRGITKDHQLHNLPM